MGGRHDEHGVADLLVLAFPERGFREVPVDQTFLVDRRGGADAALGQCSCRQPHEHLARERVVLGVQGTDPVEGVDDVGSALQSVQQEVDRLGRLLGFGPMPLDHGRPP